MSGQFRPVAGNNDVVWRTFVQTDKGQYYAAVLAEHGSTRGESHLCIWSPNHDLLHRRSTSFHLNALTGADYEAEAAWDSEIAAVLQNKQARVIEGAE